MKSFKFQESLTSIFFLKVCAFYIISKKSLPNRKPGRFYVFFLDVWSFPVTSTFHLFSVNVGTCYEERFEMHLLSSCLSTNDKLNTLSSVKCYGTIFTTQLPMNARAYSWTLIISPAIVLHTWAPYCLSFRVCLEIGKDKSSNLPLIFQHSLLCLHTDEMFKWACQWKQETPAEILMEIICHTTILN